MNTMKSLADKYASPKAHKPSGESLNFKVSHKDSTKPKSDHKKRINELTRASIENKGISQPRAVSEWAQRMGAARQRIENIAHLKLMRELGVEA